MLPEFKKRIDTLRDILVGAVPSPAGQIEQITYALIYKFMSDLDDRSTILPGGKRTYFTGEYRKYSWHELMASTLGAHDRLTLYREALGSLAKNPGLPELFQGIYQNAYLTFNDPRVLTLFLKEIDQFKHSNSDDIGDAYEYLLQITGAQGDVGQFRTPRHIIKFIVEAVNPTKSDSVLDPAVGTAGFLIAAYNHVKHHHDGVDDITGLPTSNEQRLTADELDKLHKNYHGFDIDPTMVRTAKVNMYLHGFKTPDIKNHDSLSSEDFWNERYDVILANPPFMSPKGGIKPHDKFGITANRAEVLFVDYIASHLKPTGRAGIIVPEGIIFQNNKAYKELRKRLVNDGLWCVVSLPSGIFQPYSGVKTSILLMDKVLAKKFNHLMFITITADGFELGANRRPIVINDLPNALKLIQHCKKEIGAGSIREDHSFPFEDADHAISVAPLSYSFEKVDRINEEENISLQAGHYAVQKNQEHKEWPMVTLGEVLDYEQPTKYIVKDTNYNNAYSTPVLTAGKTFILGYTNETNNIFEAARLPVIIFDDFTTATKLVNFPFKVKSSAMKILHAKANVNIEYAYYIMQYLKFTPVEHKRFWISQYSKLKIPLPSIEIQREVAAELGDYQRIIDAAQLIVRTYKDTVQVNSEWKLVKIGDVFKTSSGGTPARTKQEYYQDGTIPWLGSGEISQGKITQSKNYITEDALKHSSAKVFPINSVLIAMYGATVGQVGILKFESSTNQAVCAILPNEEVAIPEYTYHLMKSYKSILLTLSIGGAQPNISQQIIRNLVIPLPPIVEQRKIVDQLNTEQALVDANKKLVELYTEKIKNKISEIWGE